MFRAFQKATQPWPSTILFGQAGSMILRGSGRGQPCQGRAIVFHGIHSDGLCFNSSRAAVTVKSWSLSLFPYTSARGRASQPGSAASGGDTAAA